MTDPNKVAAKLKKEGYAAMSSAELHIAAWQLTPGGCHACPPMSETERLVEREVRELTEANLQARNAAAQRALNA